MVVEHEPGAVQGAQEQGDRPEDVRWVAGLEHREPAAPARLERPPRGRRERVHVLGDEAGHAAAGRVGPVLVQLDRVQDRVRGVAWPLRAHDSDLVAGRDERLALEPNPPVEWHREVLDDDQDTFHQPSPS